MLFKTLIVPPVIALVLISSIVLVLVAFFKVIMLLLIVPLTLAPELFTKIPRNTLAWLIPAPVLLLIVL